MSGGPFRVPQSADRRPLEKPEPVNTPPEISQPETVRAEPIETTPQPQVVSHSSRRTSEEKKEVRKNSELFKRFKFPLLGAIVAIVAVVGLVAAFSPKNNDTAIDTDKYQAVFFTNGQVYFGKLQSLNSDYLKLTDVYYLQTQATGETDSANTQKAADTKQNIIKLGDEIHGPEDEMIISRDQVLFYENLKTDGKVAQSIAQSKKP